MYPGLYVVLLLYNIMIIDNQTYATCFLIGIIMGNLLSAVSVSFCVCIIYACRNRPPRQTIYKLTIIITILLMYSAACSVRYQI